MTAQLAKVLERFLGGIMLPFLSSPGSVGPNQFAYSKGHGSRDALLFLTASWLHAFMEKKRVAAYCSDVSGAFDRVCFERL